MAQANSSTTSPTKADVRTRYNVSPDDFVRVYNTSSSLDEVEAKLAKAGTPMPKKAIQARASLYRRPRKFTDAAGVEQTEAPVNLKRFSRNSKARIDRSALNKVAEEALKSSAKKS